MSKVLSRFWAWYHRHYTVNLTIATGLFTFQLIHLYWLTTHVVFLRLFGESSFTPPPFWEFLIILVDYTEIPALISTTLLYLYILQREFSWKPLPVRTPAALFVFLRPAAARVLGVLRVGAA